MTTPVAIREVGTEACAAVAAIEAASFDVPWSVTAVGALLEDGLTRVWEARTSTGIVGMALLRVVAGEGELLRIAVHPEVRRQGLGGALLKAVLSAIADACPLGVFLEVRAANVAARRLYTREGFIESGRRRDYYQAPPEDAIVMQWRPDRGGPGEV
jgi:ribosomal-protein-alanine N-acetyltransferase